MIMLYIINRITLAKFVCPSIKYSIDQASVMFFMLFEISKDFVKLTTTFRRKLTIKLCLKS